MLPSVADVTCTCEGNSGSDKAEYHVFEGLFRRCHSAGDGYQSFSTMPEMVGEAKVDYPPEGEGTVAQGSHLKVAIASYVID
jgi:hypothetical protein